MSGTTGNRRVERNRRPRVLLLVENESVPTDRRVWDEASVLAKEGYDVTVICPVGTDGDRPLSERLDGIEIRRFPLQPADGGAIGFLVEYGQAMVRMLRLLWSTPGPVSVVHVANPPDFLFVLGLAAKARWRSKVIFDHHDLSPELFEARFGPTSPLLPIVRIVERLNFNAVDAVISTNESYRRVAMERGGMDPDRVTVVRNARSRSRFGPRDPDPTLRRGKPLMAVYVGAMGPQDGADCAVRVAAHYRHDLGRHDLHVVMVGDGDARADAEALASTLGVDDMVEFVGWQSRDEVVRYLSSADIGLATDPPNPLNDHSTMIKVIEYLAMGLPVVSFDLAESMVTAGDAALYTEGLDEADMAANLARLADDPDLRRRLSAVAVERTEGPLSWETSREALISVYDRLLDGEGAPLEPVPASLAPAPVEASGAPAALDQGEVPAIIAVTPAHNEAEHIGDLIASVAAQTVRPSCWVIVDDGSTDDTYAQIIAHGAGHDFIVPITRPRPPERRLSAKAETVAHGYQLALEHCPDAEFVVSMDADIVVPVNAFEFLLTPVRRRQSPRRGRRRLRAPGQRRDGGQPHQCHPRSGANAVLPPRGLRCHRGLPAAGRRRPRRRLDGSCPPAGVGDEAVPRVALPPQPENGHRR